MRGSILAFGDPSSTTGTTTDEGIATTTGQERIAHRGATSGASSTLGINEVAAIVAITFFFYLVITKIATLTTTMGNAARMSTVSAGGGSGSREHGESPPHGSDNVANSVTRIYLTGTILIFFTLVVAVTIAVALLSLSGPLAKRLADILYYSVALLTVALAIMIGFQYATSRQGARMANAHWLREVDKTAQKLFEANKLERKRKKALRKARTLAQITQDIMNTTGSNTILQENQQAAAKLKTALEIEILDENALIQDMVDNKILTDKDRKNAQGIIHKHKSAAAEQLKKRADAAEQIDRALTLLQQQQRRNTEQLEEANKNAKALEKLLVSTAAAAADSVSPSPPAEPALVSTPGGNASGAAI